METGHTWKSKHISNFALHEITIFTTNGVSLYPACIQVNIAGR